MTITFSSRDGQRRMTFRVVAHLLDNGFTIVHEMISVSTISNPQNPFDRDKHALSVWLPYVANRGITMFIKDATHSFHVEWADRTGKLQQRGPFDLESGAHETVVID